MASYEKRESGLWSVRFSVTDGNSLAHTKRLSGFKTKHEAVAAYEKMLVENEQKEAVQSHTEPEKLLFDTVLVKYLEFLKSRNKPSSYYDLSRKIDNHITPYFSGRIMKDITPSDVLEWQLSIDHYAYKTKTGLRTCLSSIYKYANRYYDIPDIMAKVDGFRDTSPKKKMDFYTKEEFEKFVSFCDSETYSMFFRFLYITGCRKGEALALSPSDFDFVENIVHITKSLTRKVDGAPWSLTTPKNKSSIRDIELPSEFAKGLKSFLDGHLECNFAFGGNEPLTDRGTTRYFEQVAERAGLKRIRIHDLRHSCASLLIASGVSIVAVSHRLGHSDVEQTLNTYAHLMPSESERILSAFGGV